MQWQDQFATRTGRLKPSAIREILKLTQRGDVISFAGGLPAPTLFPVEAIEAATQRVMREHGRASMQYSTTEGHPPLRAWVASRFDGVGPDHVQIVSGSQQGLDLVAKCFFDPGDVVVVAAPTYVGALRAFEPYEVGFRPVETDDDGIVPASLEAAFAAGAAMLYVIPDFDNPTGVTLSLERRHAIVELARRYDVPILEDDPYGELRFEGEPLPRLYDLAPDIVIHLGTFSKTLAPGFRVAWIVAPPDALVPIVRAKQAADLHTSTFVQMIATETCRDGALEPHVEQIRAYYRHQRDLMLDAMKRHFPADVRWTTPQGGMFLWVTLPDGLDASELAYDAIEAGVAYVPGTAFFHDGSGANTLRLSYSVSTPEQIETGIASLGELFSAAG